MIIIGENLKQLSEQYKIVDSNYVEEFCISLTLGGKCYYPLEGAGKLIYGVPNQDIESRYELRDIVKEITISPGKGVIACSRKTIKMPNGYFGLLQTKGSLARMFVQISCNDGQVEPGFEGFVTFEIVNMSPWDIEIPYDAPIGQLYIFKCSSLSEQGYVGRYSDSAKLGPTIPVFPA